MKPVKLYTMQKKYADTIYNTCIIKVVPGCSGSWASTTWKWGPLPGTTLMMKPLRVSKFYITIEVFCSANSMVHVTKRTRRRGACFPYPRRTWWAPRHTVSSWSQDKSTYTFKERNHTARFRRGGGASGGGARRGPRVPREGKSGLVRTNAYASLPSVLPLYKEERKCKERRRRRGGAALVRRRCGGGAAVPSTAK